MINTHYFCTVCKNSGEWEDVRQRVYPATRYDPEEVVVTCPHCGRDDTLDDAPWYCDSCDTYYPGYRMSAIDNLCTHCAQQAMERIEKHVKRLKDKPAAALWAVMKEVFEDG